ncbi:hypothetical protein HC928_16445, partial [bacterium]|nr:hypothetical protein [bacterium]
TSTHELRRLTSEQIIQLNGQEVALRTIPDGCEFLMRWRYRDIQSFLAGETVQPGDVFNAVHDVFQRYVDFKSPVESRMLTLWVIGTYFYTMFPAILILPSMGRRTAARVPSCAWRSRSPSTWSTPLTRPGRVCSASSIPQAALLASTRLSVITTARSGDAADPSAPQQRLQSRDACYSRHG